MLEERSGWSQAFDAVIASWNQKHIVTSPDVDGVLSALLLRRQFNSKIAGVYTTRRLLLFNDATSDEALDALWLDHDISHPRVRCIGQHLILHSPHDQLPLRCKDSFNPNHYFQQTLQQSFRGVSGKKRDKYPFATIHFLMHAFSEQYPKEGTQAFGLFAHADSAWTAPLLYPYNANEWAALMFSGDPFIHRLCNGYTDDSRNLKAHTAVVNSLHSLGIHRRSSSTRDRANAIPAPWRSLLGAQSIRFATNNQISALAAFSRVLNYISKEVAWPIPVASLDCTSVIEGEVCTPYPDSIRQGAFDALMEDEQIFSHAITGRSQLRYTKGMNF